MAEQYFSRQSSGRKGTVHESTQCAWAGRHDERACSHPESRGVMGGRPEWPEVGLQVLAEVTVQGFGRQDLTLPPGGNGTAKWQGSLKGLSSVWLREGERPGGMRRECQHPHNSLCQAQSCTNLVPRSH